MGIRHQCHRWVLPQLTDRCAKKVTTASKSAWISSGIVAKRVTFFAQRSVEHFFAAIWAVSERPGPPVVVLVPMGHRRRLPQGERPVDGRLRRDRDGQSMGREESQEYNMHRGGAFTVALTEGLTGKADINKGGRRLPQRTRRLRHRHRPGQGIDPMAAAPGDRQTD
jgi:hypothetical protein